VVSWVSVSFDLPLRRRVPPPQHICGPANVHPAATAFNLNPAVTKASNPDSVVTAHTVFFVASNPDSVVTAHTVFFVAVVVTLW
jgi:hypothetical protein